MNNLLGTLDILRTFNMKPNYSELSRLYGKARSTIKRYYENGGKKVITRKRDSGFDFCKEEIIEHFKTKGASKKGIYEYLKDKYPHIPSYSTFRSYTSVNEIKLNKSTEPHVRYETQPGDQLQVDWKESLKMTSIDGEIFKFNIMTATLGYSRYHKFTYSITKTTEDFIRCIIDTANHLGGLPNHILTDNMSAVVSITNGTKYKHPKIKQFEKDLGIKIRLCKTRSPETKGKVESANRFLSLLIPYDGKFKDESELIEIIEKINNKVNQENNKTTNMPGVVLFKKEKEYLNPLPNKVMLESYIESVETKIVPQTLLVPYKGNGYSVPSKFINKRVKLVPIDNKLYVYYNSELVVIHEISNKKFNYNERHYIEGLGYSIKNDNTDIEKIAKDNLALLDKIRS